MVDPPTILTPNQASQRRRALARVFRRLLELADTDLKATDSNELRGGQGSTNQAGFHLEEDIHDQSSQT